jgi:pilus assembly protein Flp/PilA
MVRNVLDIEQPSESLGNFNLRGSKYMKNTLQGLYIKFQSLLSQEEGQDLVEYALVVALIALGTVTIMKTMSTDIIAVFTSINTQLTAA